jgi:hypothetical protein
MPDSAGQEKKAGWPVFNIAWSEDWRMWVFAGLEDETKAPVETYVPQSTVKGLVEALDAVAAFGRGLHPEVADHALVPVGLLKKLDAALSSYKQEVE